MENTVKITKRTVLNALDKYFAEHEFDVDVDGITVTADEVLEYVASSIAALDKKAESAAKRAAEKKEQGDELRAMVADEVEDEPQTGMEIYTRVVNKNPEITLSPAMVTARLTQLVNANMIFKGDKKFEGRTLKIYSTSPIA